MSTEAIVGLIVPRLTFRPGAYVLVTLTGSGFEVSGTAVDRGAASAWVSENPAIRRYVECSVFAIEGGL